MVRFPHHGYANRTIAGLTPVNAIRAHLSGVDCVDPPFRARALPYPASNRRRGRALGSNATPGLTATL
jgi:hypothetical protein